MIKSLRLIFTAILLAGLSNIAQAGEKKTVYSLFWAGCEAVCQGLKDYIQNEGLEIDLIIRNVERDKSRFSGFVKEARALKADTVVTWGTSTTLGIVGTLDDVNNQQFINNIPVVFTLVSDPIRSRIIESYEASGRDNVTGTRNRVPESLNIKTMRKIKPGFQRLGIIYNPSEKNSTGKVNEIRELQDDLDFELIALQLDMDAQGKPIAESIVKRVKELKEKRVDFIYLGSSTFLEQQMELFTAAAVENGLPVLSPYENLVRESQAYLSIAARDYDVGMLAGEQIKKILYEDRKPGELSILSIDQYAYVINMKTAKKIKLFPPVDILQIAEIVE